MNELKDEWSILITKLISISAVFVGLGIKIMHSVKKKKFVLFNAVLSTFFGVGLAWVLSPLLIEKLSKGYYTVVIAFIGIAGDKIVDLVMTKLEDKYFLSAVSQMIKDYFFKK
jgi:hypothetical protein